MTPVDKIKELIKKNNGIITTKMLSENNIHRQYLKQLVDEGYVVQCARGVYSLPDIYLDEYYLTTCAYSNAIYSHSTALYLYDLTDRTPMALDVTFPSNVRPDNFMINAHYINKERFELGATTMKREDGTEIRVYNLERTICDIIRDRNKIDSQIFNDAIKGYMKRSDKNLNLLYEYAKIFGISKILKMYLEVLS
ncbi:MAG: type IV toxin-antitoxin system AbiEi family antitoxin domain-containing protein [Clostridia bacterium]|nr:type IV toxin-antitoxin system AbiEi family antitoxin domain-containing protein [Clostridia bacterium]